MRLKYGCFASVTTRSDGWNIYFNQRWVDYTGMTMEESYGHGWNTPFHPDDKQHAWEAWQRATQQNERYSLECRLRRADGIYRWWLIRGVPMLGTNGEILKWFGTCTDIEELKNAEAALQEANDQLEQRVAERTAELRASEERFRLALKNSPVSVAVQDRNLVYQWAYNQQTRRPEEIVGKTDADLFAPDEVPGIIETKRKVLETGIEVHAQHWLTSNGRRLFLDLSYEPMRDAAGEVAGIGIAVVNLTEQKRAEEALSESEQRLHLAQEAAELEVWDFDPRSGLMQCGERVKAWWRLSPEGDYTYNAWLAGLHPDDREAAVGEVRRSLEPGGPGRQDLEYRVVGPDGSVRWIGIRAQTQFADIDGRQQAVRVVGTMQDITERKRAEEAMARLAAIVESSADAVLSKNLDGTVLTWNIAAERMFGYRAEEIIGQPIAQLFPPERVREEQQIMQRLKRGEEVQHFETVRLAKDGRRIEVSVTISAMRDSSGRVIGASKIVRDISDRKRAEVALREANATLERKVQERTLELAQRAAQLRALARELTLSEQRERSRLAKVLHDHVQQLLVAAKFRVTILGRGGDEVIKQASKEVEELIDESIAASRSLTAELSPPVLQEAGLKAGLQWLARRMADKQGLFVDLEMEEGVVLHDDIRILMYESVRELLFNTVKHAHTRAATVNLRLVDGYLQVTVSDQGVGFDPTAMPAAGEFGMGFGLFGIRERLELMGGTLEIESSAGQGARIVLCIPIDRPAAIKPPPQAFPVLPEAHVAPSGYPDPGHKIRIMLVDDHAVVRQGVANLLGDEPDIEVVGQAADGHQAVELAARLLPDVILMDVSMPNLNGVEATRIIHKDWPKIRIIGFSMFEEEDRARAMRDAGAEAYITKSGPEEELISAIRKSVPAPDRCIAPKISG